MIRSVTITRVRGGTYRSDVIGMSGTSASIARMTLDEALRQVVGEILMRVRRVL